MMWNMRIKIEKQTGISTIDNRVSNQFPFLKGARISRIKMIAFFNYSLSDRNESCSKKINKGQYEK